jgi:hypothetical protein
MRSNIYIALALLVFGVIGANAQTDDNKQQYRRSSLYQLMINHTEQKFADEIREVFIQMPVSEHFNDHDLAVKVLDMDKKLKGAGSDKENAAVTKWLEDNMVASRLVAKWFDRDYFTGKCDMEMIKERGLYNASAFDKAVASRSVRGKAMLEDAGEDLIGNTFVIVNDIRYVDKAKVGQAFKIGLSIAGAIFGAASGNQSNAKAFDNLGDIAETLKGFKVKINTYLYKLEWNDEIASNFYQFQYGVTDNSPAKEAFEKARGTYKLTYVGKQESSGSTTSFMGVKLDTPTAMVRKACQRAVDENVASLQHDYEEFRTKSPLISADPITAAIGLKEGIDEKSTFEVLEVIKNEDGTVKYEQVAKIRPIKNLIWDNRYMAEEEGAANSTLGFTTFKKISGGDIYPGMLIRETK